MADRSLVAPSGSRSDLRPFVVARSLGGDRFSRRGLVRKRMPEACADAEALQNEPRHRKQCLRMEWRHCARETSMDDGRLTDAAFDAWILPLTPWTISGDVYALNTDVSAFCR